MNVSDLVCFVVVCCCCEFSAYKLKLSHTAKRFMKRERERKKEREREREREI